MSPALALLALGLLCGLGPGVRGEPSGEPIPDEARGPGASPSGTPPGARNNPALPPLSVWHWRGPGLEFLAPATWEVTENTGTGFTVRSQLAVLRFGLLGFGQTSNARTTAGHSLQEYAAVSDRRIEGEGALGIRHGFQRYTIWGSGTHRGYPVRFAVVGYSSEKRRAFLRAMWYVRGGGHTQQLLEVAAESLRAMPQP